MFWEKLPEEIQYEMSVPVDPNTNTHDPDYLKKVNSSGGWEYLINAIDEKYRFWLEDWILLSRNKSPHGLGGLLIWDFSKENVFELETKRQERFYYYIRKIEWYLRKKYGFQYHILVGMCLSGSPGVGKRQSIAYTHAHVSLIPKNIWQEYLEDNGVIINPLKIKKPLSWDKYMVKWKIERILSSFGQIQEFPTGILIHSKEESNDLELPIIGYSSDKNKKRVLWARNEQWIEVWSTISALVIWETRTRLAISLWTPWYLHFDGIELKRELVDEKRFFDFNQFWELCFQEIRQLFV